MLNAFGKLKQDYLIALKEASRKQVDRCDFNDECDFCKSPTLGSFAHGVCIDEIDGYICGKCILKERNKKIV